MFHLPGFECMSRMNQDSLWVTALIDSDAVDALIGGRGRGAIRKGQSPGANISFPQITEPVPLDPLGPLAEVDFLSGFRAPSNESGPRGKHQGFAERTRAPRDGSVTALKTNQDESRRIRVPQDRSGPQDESGPRGTYLTGPTERIKAPQHE